MPGTPTSVTSCADCSVRARVSASARRSRSRSRPTSGVRSFCSTSLPKRDRAPTASQTLTGSALPFASTGRRVAVVDRLPRRAVRPLADEDPVDRRRALQPRRRVDDVAGHHRVALAGLRAERDERLAGVDGGADLQLLADRVADRERRPHRALGVVLVRDRRAEDGHHGVADELLDRAAVPLELGAELCVVRRRASRGRPPGRAPPRAPSSRRGR